jgi:biopolymer transport protein ExbD
MNRILEVCIVALTFATNITPVSHAQSPALQRGISVQMAASSSAAPMPDADNHDAWIVTVTAEGDVDFGVDPVAPFALADEMKNRPRNREQKLYIKADARVPFADVEKVLAAGRTVFFETAVLLTAQPETPQSGMEPPRGLEVLISPALPAGKVTTVVQLLNSGRQSPSLRINGDQIPWPALQSTLRQHFEKGDDRTILLKADGQLSFANVVHAIDVCHAAGAKVVLATAGL